MAYADSRRDGCAGVRHHAGMTSPRGSTGTVPRSRNRALLIGFGVLALIGVLLPATFNYLLAGDRRQLVVTMRQGVSDADRETLKQACGSLPGITVVPDRGEREAQYRFPVRFRISDTTQTEEAALNACINGYPQLVRGVLTERLRES